MTKLHTYLYRQVQINSIVIQLAIFCKSALSHRLLLCHMTSNNETFSRQNLRAGNIAKSMTSEGNSALLPTNVDRRPPLQRGLMIRISSFKVSTKYCCALISIERESHYAGFAALAIESVFDHLVITSDFECFNWSTGKTSCAYSTFPDCCRQCYH